MVIGLDIDDTIADTMGIMLPYAEKFTLEDLGRQIKMGAISGDMMDPYYVQNMHEWSKEDEVRFFSKYYRVMLEKTTPFFFAVEIINQLKKEGHKIVLITARWNTVTDEGFLDVEKITTKWLEKHGIKYDKLIVDAQNKGEVALENNVDVFVDDSLKNCISVSNKGIKTYIMDNRCNSGSNVDGITRVFSWPHLEHEIRKEIK